MNAVAEAPLRMDPERVQELDLTERIARGDETALNVLYERYADALFGYIYHALDGGQQEAEDVWQETLSAAVRSASNFRGQSRFFSWLCSIARHKVADHCRRRSRTSDRILLLPPEELASLIDKGPLPDDIVNQPATRLRVVEALGALPEDYRRALVARYGDGQSVKEVAQLLDRSYKAAESTLSRAREAFRVELAKKQESDL
jgi:RNA polymerase sigma-70 factor (ECF subfamily)